MQALVQNSSHFIEMFSFSMLMPATALIAVLLRRNWVTGKVKVVMLVIGLGLLLWATYNALTEQSQSIGLSQILVVAISGVLAYAMLAYFAHHHNEDKTDVKAIAYSEFVHSLTDGAVLGIAYFINPIFGYATFLAIATHELPKIIGTVLIIRSLTTKTSDVIKYSVISQAGIPIGSVLFYLLGHNIPESVQSSVELAAVTTLFVIVLRVAWVHFAHMHSHRHESASK